MDQARARSAFDHERLLHELANSDAASESSDTQTEPDFTEYLAFYGLARHAEHRAQVLSVDVADRRERIVLQRFSPAKPNAWAIFHHGYFDHVGLFGHVIDYLLERNIGVFAFDQVGHGLSSGERVTVQNFDHYVDVLHAVLGEIDRAVQTTPHWLGQSMGGAILLEYLQRHPDRQIKELVLFAPLIRPYAWAVNRIYFWLAKQMITERPRTITSNASNAEFLYLQHHDPLQAEVLPVAWVQAMVHWFEDFVHYPVSNRAPKIIQGHQDRTIDRRYGAKVIDARYPNTKWLQIPEASHHLANESAAIRAKMFAWLDSECQWR
ncbi:MAG: alpha/beta fold hydrolase [Pseudomonadales bacterium]|nr:alpha/beta fold hydrolase [Pseudomonadales bacterium]